MKKIKSNNILAFNYIFPALFLILFIQIKPIISSLYMSFIDLKATNFIKFCSAPFIGIKTILISRIIIFVALLSVQILISFALNPRMTSVFAIVQGRTGVVEDTMSENDHVLRIGDTTR